MTSSGRGFQREESNSRTQTVAFGYRLFRSRESEMGIPVDRSARFSSPRGAGSCTPGLIRDAMTVVPVTFTPAGRCRRSKGGRHVDESAQFFPEAYGTAGAALITALGRPEWLRGATARKASDVLYLGPDKIKVTRLADRLGYQRRQRTARTGTPGRGRLPQVRL